MIEAPLINFFSVTGLINATLNGLLGSLVLIFAKRGTKSFTFAMFCLCIAGWSVFYTAWHLTTDHSKILFYNQVMMVPVLFIPTFYFHFISCITDRETQNKKIILAAYIFSVCLAPFVFSSLFVSELMPIISPHLWPKAGPLYSLHLLMFVACVLVTVNDVWKVYRTSSGIRREQMKYILIGAAFGYGGGMMNYIPCYGIELRPYGNTCVTVYAIILAYISLIQKVVDINLAFRYGTIYSYLSVLIGTPVALAIWFVGGSVSASIIGFFAPVAGYLLIRKWKPSTTEAFVLAGKYAPHKDVNIQSHRESIINSPTLRDWAENLCRSMVKLFDVREVVVLVFDASHQYFASVAGAGLDQLSWGVPIIIENDSPLVKMLEKEKRILIKEELQQILRSRIFEAIQGEMESMSAELCMPFLMNDKVVGILALGRKTSKEMFNDLDIKSMWKVGRGAEEALRALLLGLLQQQYSSEWAHDLMHPFGPKGSLHYVKAAVDGKYGDLNPNLKQHFEDIVEEMDFVEKYMDALLNPLKYSNGVYNVRPRILSHYFEQSQRLYEEAAKEQGIQWTVRSPPHAIKVLGDAVIIFHRVIKNLLENAFRHTPRGGSIELGHRLEDKILVIFVKDSGAGIPKDKLETIFERGTQGSEGNKGKAGLGLYNARKVVESHHGKLWAESEPGKGSIFYFTLPLAPAEENIDAERR